MYATRAVACVLHSHARRSQERVCGRAPGKGSGRRSVDRIPDAPEPNHDRIQTILPIAIGRQRPHQMLVATAVEQDVTGPS